MYTQRCRPWGCRSCHDTPRFLAYQLTLSQPRLCPPNILEPPDFQTFLWPWYLVCFPNMACRFMWDNSIWMCCLMFWIVQVSVWARLHEVIVSMMLVAFHAKKPQVMLPLLWVFDFWAAYDRWRWTLDAIRLLSCKKSSILSISTGYKSTLLLRHIHYLYVSFIP